MKRTKEKECSWCGFKGEHDCPSLMLHKIKQNDKGRQEIIIRCESNFVIEWLGNNILVKEEYE